MQYYVRVAHHRLDQANRRGNLLDVLSASAPARVVNVASSVHMKAKLDLFDVHAPRRYAGLRTYSRSKLCNVLFTYELARRE